MWIGEEKGGNPTVAVVTTVEYIVTKNYLKAWQIMNFYKCWVL